MTYVVLVNQPGYEILDVYPHTIRRCSNHFIPKMHMTPDGYYRINLDGKCYLVHRLIARQFIPNDDPTHRTEVDHVNGIRTDNHIDNLRWTDRCSNMRNLHQSNNIAYEFVDELEGNAYEIDHASRWDFKDYYACGDKVLFFDGDRYRTLIKHPNGLQWHVYMKDVDGIKHTITKHKLQDALRDTYGIEFF